jgi:hypothetical protein
MAVNIFDKYGIKEVANVYFEALDDDLKAGVYKGDIVLFLDTLKVSTVETTAESTDATGGWGNPKLITWDYGKEITLTLEDALISLESLRFMLGGAIHRPTSAEPVVVRHTEEVVVDASGKVPLPKDHLTGVTLTPKATTGHPIRLINLTTGVRTQITSGTMGASNTITFTNPAAGASEVAAAAGDHIRIFWEELVTAENAQESAIEVTISPDTFPGTYRVVGDTFMRSEKTGKDEAFQFVINKAKVLSEVTITLEAEGDPSTFEMTLNVLRSDNERGEKEMMKLIRYTIAESASTESANDIGSLTTGS